MQKDTGDGIDELLDIFAKVLEEAAAAARARHQAADAADGRSDRAGEANCERSFCLILAIVMAI